MKRDFLEGLLNSGKDSKEIIDSIMASNGEDINNARANYQVDPNKYVGIDKYNELAEANKGLTSKNTELTNQFAAYKTSTADYEDIKGKYNDLLAEQDKTKKLDFLKGQGCKYSDLLVGQFDWAKVDFDKNEVDKDYMDGVKSQYQGLFEAKEEPYTPSLPGGPRIGNPQDDDKLTNEELQKL